MTLDDGVHLLETKAIHLAPAWVIMGIGFLLNNDMMLAFAGGMLVVLLFGNLRRVDTYRWRVD